MSENKYIIKRTARDSADLFDALGFEWDRSLIPENIPIHDVRRASFRLQKMLAEYVWDAAVLEGNPITFPQVQTILDGITVGGHKISDQDQIINLAESTKELLKLVNANAFALDKKTFIAIHSKVAKEEALEWGNFRGEGREQRFTPHVSLGEAGSYDPIKTEPGAIQLNKIFTQGLAQLEPLKPFEKGAAFFLFGALQQFFFDGNKRTSRMMMNGVLMSHGIDAISIPAARAQEFNEKMVDFYVSRNAAEMMRFLVSCHPDF